MAVRFVSRQLEGVAVCDTEGQRGQRLPQRGGPDPVGLLAAFVGGHNRPVQRGERLGDAGLVAVDLERATRAATLKQRHNLGYADAFAAELALDRGAWLVTADPEFSRLGKILSVYALPQHGKN